MRSTRRLIAGALALLAVPLLSTPVAASASMPRDLPAKSPKGSQPNVTFGAGPASAKGPDGRSLFNYVTGPGGTATDHLNIFNDAYRAERLEVYPADAVVSSTGSITYPLATAPRRQAGAWISVGTPKGSGYVTVPARKSIILPLRIQVPDNASPGDHVGAVIVSLNGKVTGKFGASKANSNFDQRIAVEAEFRIQGPLHPILQVQGLHTSYAGTIDPFASGKATVIYNVHNAGNVVLGGPQTVSVHGMFGQTETVQPPAIPALLPGATYHVVATLPHVYPEVFMKTSVQIREAGLSQEVTPGLTTISANARFMAWPWMILAALLILILLIAWGVARWRRRRADSVISSPPSRRVPSGAQA